MTGLDDKTLKKILLDENYVTEEDLKKAEEFAKTRRSSITEYLIAEGFISTALLGQAIAEHFKVRYSDLAANEPSQEQVLKIPEAIAKKYHVVLFALDKKRAVIATDKPDRDVLKKELKRIFPEQAIELTYSLPENIEANFIHYQKPLETQFTEILKRQHRIAPELLDAIFSDAIVSRASDIHFEPQQKEVIVRFRVDGALREAGRIPKEFYENLLNRIKVQSRMRIDEHFAAQDGSLHYEHSGYAVDLRASIVPTVEGEKVVLRVLTAYVQGFTLANLGLLPRDQQTLEEAAQKPFGMILVTGPTGSGKTTTLYAVLKMLNQPDVNITTVEDPVEYKMPGINQIQVNALTNLTFAKGLRSIVRQDPDVILVGEIRDTETAEIAVNAALTGHLLLSTFHANDAATAIPRLLDMSIEPFLLASTLNVVIAQRLVRKICDRCKYSVAVAPKTLPLKNAERFFGKAKINLYQGKGCASCHDTGYQGRVAVLEIIQISPDLQALILTNPSAQQVWKMARENGSISMFEDGVEKVKGGITTLDELLRVAEPPVEFD